MQVGCNLGDTGPTSLLTGHPNPAALERVSFAETSSGSPFTEGTRLGLQKRCDLVDAHADLVSNRDKTLGKVFVVFAQQLESDHEIVDVAEDEGTFFYVCNVFAG